MSCHESRALLDGYVDGELDLVSAVKLEEHLRDCAKCRAILDEVKALHQAIQNPGVYYRPPPNLESSVRAALKAPQSAGSSFRWRPWLIAASIAAVLLLTVLVLVYALKYRPSNEILAQEVVSSHIRSLMANHLTDVASSSQHTVKPWFAGKLDFAPMVRDLAPQGFPLAGGRLDYLNGRPVAALVYQRRQHIINLFIWPSTDSDTEPRSSTIKGYDLIHWTHARMTYWAVSDLNAAELAEFAQDQRK